LGAAISPQAYVDKAAELADGVEVGPFAYVGPGVRLGDGCVLHHHASVAGHTTVGPGNQFYPGCYVGEDPQDLKYRGTATKLVVGDHNVFREMVTVHRGTEVGGGETRIGNDNRFLVGVHIAHDVIIGNKCVIANAVQFAGHVVLEDGVNIGGMVGLHHFVTIGRNAFIGGLSRVTRDIPPFTIAQGYEGVVRALNTVGLQRWAFSKEEIGRLRKAFKALYSKRAAAGATSLLERLDRLEAEGDIDDNVRYMCDFIRRATVEGSNGRYLESRRQDSQDDRKHFYDDVDHDKAVAATEADA